MKLFTTFKQCFFSEAKDSQTIHEDYVKLTCFYLFIKNCATSIACHCIFLI